MTPLLPNSSSHLATPAVNYGALAPIVVLLVAVLVLMLSRAIASRASAVLGPPVIVAAGLLTGVSGVAQWIHFSRVGATSAMSGSLVIDGFSIFAVITVGVAVALYGLMQAAWASRSGDLRMEPYLLAMVSGAGAILMTQANDLIATFIGLEVLSIPLYVMAAIGRRGVSGEAGLKYFVLGAFASAVFVYGIALTYGATGSTNLAAIGNILAQTVLSSNGLLLAGMGLMVVGLAFKVAAVPFHLWSPDVYQGAPTPATGYMAAVAKIGGFGALFRILLVAFPAYRADWQPIVYGLAITSVVLGSVAAIAQRDVKRMLAYSSISHAGFILIGLAAANSLGVAGAAYYLMTYSIMVLGTFAVVAHVGGESDANHDLVWYRGLARRRPLVAFTLTVLLLSQAGAPFTIGFWAKFYVIQAAVAAHSIPLAVIGMAAAVAAAFFYLRIVISMYNPTVQPAPRPEPALVGAEPVAGGPAESRPDGDMVVYDPGKPEIGSAVTFALTSLAAVALGVWPGPLVDLARRAILGG